MGLGNSEPLHNSSRLEGVRSDLIWGAGAATAPCLLLTPWLIASLGADAALLFPLLALLCNYPHYAATWLRFMQLVREGHEPQRRTQLLHVLTLIGMALTLLNPATLAPFLTLYLLWSPWHYAGQNYGMTLYFLRREKLVLNYDEQRLLRVSFMASTLMAWLFLMRAGGEAPGLISLSLPKTLASSVGVLAIIAQLSAVAFALRRIFRLTRQAQRLYALAPAALLILAQLVWFSSLLLPLMGMRLPFLPARLGTGDIAILHCAQYLWFTAQVQAATSSSEHAGTDRASPRWLKLFSIGALLWILLPWLLSRGLGADYQHAVLVTTVWVNLHHFVMDGWIWKLRQANVRAALGLEPAPPHAHTPLHSATSRCRATWGLLALSLSCLAMTDLYFRRGLLYPDAPGLRAQLLKLNPNSATLHNFEGVALLEQGARAQALRHFEDATQIQPLDAVGWHNLAMLIADENAPLAIAHLERATTLAPDLYAARLKLGILYAQAGDARARMHLEYAARSPTHRVEAQRWLTGSSSHTNTDEKPLEEKTP
ncbi:MAG: hypothetical protein ACKO6N_20505 [Myxococcota bacterium]